MPTTSQFAFNRGEIAPSLRGNASLSAFQSGLAACRNMVVQAEGGVKSRGGFEHDIEHPTSAGPSNPENPGSRLIPFRFSSNRTYMLELGDKFMRVHKDGAPITFGERSTESVAYVPDGDGTEFFEPGYNVFTYTAHGLADGDEVKFWGINGPTAAEALNNGVYKVRVDSVDTFVPIDPQTGYPVHGIDGTFTAYGKWAKVLRVVTPWPSAALNKLQARQRGDVIRTTTLGFPAQEIRCLSDTSWTVTPVVVGATILAPTNMAGGDSGAGWEYAATAVSEVGDESLLSDSTSNTTDASIASPVVLTWDSSTGAAYYNIYKRYLQGGWGFIGTAAAGAGPTFTDRGSTPDYATTPPIEYNPFLGHDIAITEIEGIDLTVPVYDASWHNSGLLLALAVGASPAVRFFYRDNIASPKLKAVPNGTYAEFFTSNAHSIGFSPDGSKFFAACNQSFLSVFFVRPSGVSADGRHVVSFGGSPYVLIPYLYRVTENNYVDKLELSTKFGGGAIAPNTMCWKNDSSVLYFRMLGNTHCVGKLWFGWSALPGGDDITVSWLYQTVFNSPVAYNYYKYLYTNYRPHAVGGGTAYYDVSNAMVLTFDVSGLALDAVGIDHLTHAPDRGLFVQWRISADVVNPLVYASIGNALYLLGDAIPPADVPMAYNATAFSPDSRYLAVAETAARNIVWYLVTGSGTDTVFTKLASPAQPTAGPTSLTWTANGKYLIVGESGSPYAECYSVDEAENTLTLVSNFAPSDIPASSVNAIVMDPVGKSMILCQDAGNRVAHYSATYTYPATAAYYQQRMAWANTDWNPLGVEITALGTQYNFNKRVVPQGKDGFTYIPDALQMDEVRHLVNLGRELVCLSAGGVVTLSGANDGVFEFSSTQSKQHSADGASWVEPAVMDDTLLYAQDGNNTIRDLRYQQSSENFSGNDLTRLSAHLFKGKTICRLALQRQPQPVLWVLLSDGTLAAVTYARESNTLGWSRHDTDGKFVDIACVREGGIDRLYAMVDRAVLGVTRRFVERLSYSTGVDPLWGHVELDACVNFDGRNKNASLQITIASGETEYYVGWPAGVYNITANADLFASPVAEDGDNVYFMYYGDGLVLPLTIESVTDARTAKARSSYPIPVDLQNKPTSQWALGVCTITGLTHLAGEAVGVFADGAVVASPNNPDYTEVIVSTDGIITLPYASSVVHVGRQYLCDIETLNVESPDSTLVNIAKLVGQVTIQVQDTLGIYAGQEDPGGTSPINKLDKVEKPYHQFAANASRSILPPFSGTMRGIVRNTWKTEGRFFMRKIDPVPWHLLSVHLPLAMERS